MSILRLIPFLKYGKSGIEIDGVSYERIIEKYGTPVFVFSKQRFEENIHALRLAFEQPFSSFKLAFAFKANTVLPILKIAAQNGLLAEVMSDFELHLAELAGFKSENMVYNGPAKSRDELVLATKKGVGFINCDSFSEVKELEKLCKDRESKVPISVRVHPPLDPALEKQALVKRGSKLGLDLDRARRIYRYIEKSQTLEPYGIHTHLGTQITSPELHVSVAKALSNFIIELKTEGIILEGINLGGGFASRYIIENSNNSLETFALQIKDALAAISFDYTLFLEPGRFLIGDTIVALTRIIRKKKSWGKVWNLLDIGANVLVPLRFSQYDLLPITPKPASPTQEVGGPLCLPVDVLKETINFETQEQDILVILNAGAYTFSLSEQFGYLRPPLCMIHNKQIKTLLRRERMDDFLQLNVE